MREAKRRGGLRASWLAALLTIAATYFYFLLFAEFAFLELAGAVATTPSGLRLLMTGLGGGGVFGAAFGAWRWRADKGGTLLAWALRGCALGAGFALLANSVFTLFAVGVVVGLSLGMLTVVLASSLREATAGRHLGLCIGLGTGLAYGLCNVPGIFRAAPTMQALLALLATGVASFLPRLMLETAPSAHPQHQYTRANVARWGIILLALVWMDSAAFYIVQHTAALQATTWSETSALYANAIIHVLAAVAAGVLLDRGWRRAITGVAGLALALACLMLNGAVPAFLPAVWFYTAGVSLYSTVLVEYPARDGRPWVAAFVFGVAGWLGSAFGIGMAQDLATVPVAFIATAGGVMAIALMWRTRAATYAVATIALVTLISTLRADEIALGREVYIAEGCIHCHSQYVRPRSGSDVEQWGPATSLRETLAAAPPLIGTRRQGPDLSHVGNRRTPEWNRLHLIAPQTISPGSRMPSYAHLFASDSRGDALVAYLASLGAESRGQRWTQVAAWQPKAGVVGNPAHSQQLFLRLCVPCHGENGRGDGALAARLSVPPADWARSPWRHVPPGSPTEVVLCRIIKFGLPGLPMAGHEYLPDADVVGLARFVQTLHKADGAGTTAAAKP